MWDAVIVGGGAAGLSAALYLGRFRRKVLVIDGGKPANRFSHAAHGFFTRDGISPQELLEIGREQLQQYDTIEIVSGEVVDAQGQDNRFEVRRADGSVDQARRILLASGLRDEMPLIEGLDRYWGHGVFHCPFCDGWEQRDRSVAIVNSGAHAVHFAKLLTVLTDDLVICSNGPAALDDEQQRKLDRRGIRVIETPIARIEGSETAVEQVVFSDGTNMAREAVFIGPITTPYSDLGQRLGCTANEAGVINVDDHGHTSVMGVYAAGDASQMPRQLVLAVRQGSMAAMAMIHDLLTEDFDGG